MAVGEPQIEMFDTVEQISSYMDKNKPRYLMGTGTPGDLLGAVKGVLICLIVFCQQGQVEMVLLSPEWQNKLTKCQIS